MKNCPKCSNQVEDNVSFCPYCGAAVEAPIDPFDHSNEFDAQDISDNKVYAMLSYLTGVLGIIIALLAAKDSKYLAFHIRQVVKLQVVMILSAFLAIIPILGWFAAPICIAIIMVIAVICFFRVCAGKSIEPPIVRSFSFLK